MLAAALVVAVVAAAGIGYATQYTAQTSNDGNTLESTYIVISETGGTAYKDILTKVWFNTINTGTNNGTTVSSVTTYKPVYTHTIGTDNIAVAGTSSAPGTYAKISDDLTLTFDMGHTTDTTASFTVTISDFTAVNDIQYTMLLNSANHNYKADFTTGNTWSFSSIDLSGADSTTHTLTYTVSIYISVTSESGEITPGTEQNISTAGFSANGSTLTFVATAGQAA